MVADGAIDASVRAVELVQGAVLGGEAGIVSVGAEGQVRRAIDLLRAEAGDTSLLQRLEQISCQLMEMASLLRQGRVNAYASQLLRLRRTAAQL